MCWRSLLQKKKPHGTPRSRHEEKKGKAANYFEIRIPMAHSVRRSSRTLLFLVGPFGDGGWVKLCSQFSPHLRSRYTLSISVRKFSAYLLEPEATGMVGPRKSFWYGSVFVLLVRMVMRCLSFPCLVISNTEKLWRRRDLVIVGVKVSQVRS